MNTKNIYFFILFIVGLQLQAQHTINIQATLDKDLHTIQITQEITYVNTSNKTLSEIYLNDWANSFSSKKTALAKRFAENYQSDFHFEKDAERGRTTIVNISNKDLKLLSWKRTQPDIIKVKLDNPLLPNQSYTLKLIYTVKIPKDKYTRYGFTKEGDYKLRYWYISPAVFDGKWHAYSNKNTEDLYLTPSTFKIAFSFPKEYTLVTDLDTISEEINDSLKTIYLEGKQRTKAGIYVVKNSPFEVIQTDKVTVITSYKDSKVTPEIKALAIDRIVQFLDKRLGAYPFKKIIATEEAYKNSPVYGLNQLPDFISPYPDGFQYNIAQLKTISRAYLENTIIVNPREESWLIGALQIYLMMEYVDTYYPNIKLLGNLSNLFVINWSHISELSFNDQYAFMCLNMTRNNLHQSLTTARDSLLKFNKNIANDYYGGIGFKYLADYAGKKTIDSSIKEFFETYKLKPTSAKAFETVLEKNASVSIDWFFDNYIQSRNTLDFKIKKVNKKGDSLQVTIFCKRKNKTPVSLYGLNKNKIIFKKWLAPIDSISTVTVPAKDVTKLALNYEGKIPEINRRNNFKNLQGLLNKPLQVRLFKDAEDPNYNQLFMMPVYRYNLYDGLTLGAKFYNKTFLRKPFHYKLSPHYGLRSKNLVGAASFLYRQNIEHGTLYTINYGFSGSYFSYDVDLFYKRYSPYINLAFRNKDLRNNEKRYINIRYVSVNRDKSPFIQNQEPNYKVFNLQYVYKNPNLINYLKNTFDFQISKTFTKLSSTLEYRKLLQNNRQINLRVFGGLFLANNNDPSNNYFSFALDRPTDYLFDYDYYGRSEETGLFSQQIIIAEGGFKSKLEPAFSNNWMITGNASTNIWNWIYIYGDAGIVQNKGKSTKFVYDSGIRLSLLADYFEVFLPLYSNLGWEPGLPNYDQRIRFIVTLSPKTLAGLFTRRWY